MAQQYCVLLTYGIELVYINSFWVVFPDDLLVWCMCRHHVGERVRSRLGGSGPTKNKVRPFKLQSNHLLSQWQKGEKQVILPAGVSKQSTSMAMKESSGTVQFLIQTS